ncbi:MAG: insulinase family protein [Nanoarchaeota archaeon]
MDYSKFRLKNNIPVYVCQSPLYVQTNVKLKFYSANNESNAAKTLAVRLMMEGSRHFPTSQAINLATLNEFDAGIGGGCGMNSGLHVAGFSISALTKESLTGGQNTLENMAALLADIINEPLIESGRFNNEYFIKKKEELIVGVKQAGLDKDIVAERKFLELALGKNSHTMPVAGDLKEVEGVRNEDAAGAYSRMIAEIPRMIFVGTSLEPWHVAEVLDRVFGNLPEVNKTPAFAAPPEKNAGARLEDDSEFDQSVVYAGFPFSIPETTKERHALQMLAFYMGGYSGGRLFTEIRTKRDMAYGAFAGIDFETGLMHGVAGVDIKNKDKTIEIIINEFSKAANGKITKSGIANAKRYVLSQIGMNMHSKARRMGFLENSVLSNRPDEIAGYEQRYSNVEYEDVLKAASRINPSPIVYCLKQGDKK